MEKKIFYVLISLVTLLGCQPKHDESSELPSSNQGKFTPADLVKFQEGETLYNQNCMSCHNALAGSTKRNKTSQQISGAIFSVPVMSGIVLTDQELLKITFSLAHTLKEIQDDLAGRDPASELPASALSGLGVFTPKATRSLLVSKFQNLFIDAGNPNASDANIETKLKTLISDNPNLFGGFCHELDPDCIKIANSHELSKNSKNLTAANSLRSGYLSRVCSEVLSYDNAVVNVLNLAGLTVSSSFTDSNIKSVWNEMIPTSTLGNVLSTEEQVVLDSLKVLQADALSKGQSNTAQWRAILSVICESPLMEAI